ncbi:alpha/beta fold hydrolase [Rhodococcus sp. NPDC059234]|uniref:alpha/beta fold hydrolase n=1 Tax=Rhodococcus sp. NPDC059234 TaxID=3346781 RepID=UPI0036709EFB
MPYEFPVDHNALIEERSGQFLSFGLAPQDLAHARAAIDSMWSDAPGGWVHEWSRLAAKHSARGDHALASMVYGIAKFPVLANESRRRALRHQVDEYLRAADGFGVRFERRVLTLPYRSGAVELPVHLFSADGKYSSEPVLLLSGGVDGWKMDIHPLAVAFAQDAGVTVLAFDQPGTGESPVPLDEFGDEVVDGLIAAARGLGDGKVGHLGVSFGGNFAVRSGLTGAVDAAINIGAPVAAAFEVANLERLLYGMADIVGNAVGFDAPGTREELIAATRVFDRRDLLRDNHNAPMLVVNGADDVHVPLDDTLIFEGRPDTEVHVIPGAGHCAVTKLPELTPMMVDWLRSRLAPA